MSRETEKVMKQLMQYMEAHQDELGDGVDENDLAQRFMAEYNATVQPRNVRTLPQTADDYLELAEDATSKKKKLEYLSKALELEPDNLDAARMTAELNAKKPEDLLAFLSTLIEKGNSLMEKEGYFQDCMGDFWGVLETRPYMRLRDSYLELLIQCGMMRKAVGEAEEMLKLSTNDNLGVRYTLMHLYAYLENEDSALALHKKYDEYEESQMLLPLAVLYYKKGNFELSLQYLQRLNKANKDTKKFLNAVAHDRVFEYLDTMSPYGYRPFSIEELVQEYVENHYLFDRGAPFFDWAYRSLKKASGSVKTSK